MKKILIILDKYLLVFFVHTLHQVHSILLRKHGHVGDYFLACSHLSYAPFSPCLLYTESLHLYQNWVFILDLPCQDIWIWLTKPCSIIQFGTWSSVMVSIPIQIIILKVQRSSKTTSNSSNVSFTVSTIKNKKIWTMILKSWNRALMIFPSIQQVGARDQKTTDPWPLDETRAGHLFLKDARAFVNAFVSSRFTKSVHLSILNQCLSHVCC